VSKLVSKGEICSLDIPEAETDLAIVTLEFTDENFRRHILRRLEFGREVRESSSWVITRDGKMVMAEAEAPWISAVDRRNHLNDVCPACNEVKRLCDLCYISVKLANIGNCLRAVERYVPRKELNKFLAEVKFKQIYASNDQVKKLVEEIKSLATRFSKQEVKTKMLVGEVQNYGQIWKEAAEDFLEDGNWKDFLIEVMSFEDVRKELKETIEDNNLIQDEVERIKCTAETEAANFKEKKEIAEERLSRLEVFSSEAENYRWHSFYLFPPTGFNPLAAVMIVGGLKVASLVAQAMTAPRIGEAVAFKCLEDEANKIFQQMGLVQFHLQEIVHCLLDINKKLGLGKFYLN